MAAIPTIRINVAGLAAGTPGVSRTATAAQGVGQVVTLADPANTGSGTHLWELIPPYDSAATLSSTSSPSPTFTVDVPGDYLLFKTFTDGAGAAASFTPDVTIPSLKRSIQGGLRVFLANGTALPAAGETQQFSSSQGWATAAGPLFRASDARLPSAPEKTALVALPAALPLVPSAPEKSALASLPAMVPNSPTTNEKTSLGQLDGGARGSLFYSAASGRAARLAPPSGGVPQVLSHPGVIGDPLWIDPPAGGGGGGMDAAFIGAPAGNIWYAGAVGGAITRLASPTPGPEQYMLSTAGAGAGPQWATAADLDPAECIYVNNPTYTMLGTAPGSVTALNLGPKSAKLLGADFDWRVPIKLAVEAAATQGKKHVVLGTGDYGVTKSAATSGYGADCCIDLSGAFASQVIDLTFRGQGWSTRLYRLDPTNGDCTFMCVRNGVKRVLLTQFKIDGMYISTHGTNTLTFTAVSVVTQTVTVGDRVYTWVTTPSAPDEVAIGASATASRDNLLAALSAGAGAGTVYGTGTVANEFVTAVAGPTGTTIVTTSIPFVPAGLADTVTVETMANASWLFPDHQADSQPEQNHLIKIGETTAQSTGVQGCWVENVFLYNCRGDAFNVGGENVPIDFLNLTGQPLNTETVTIDGVVYTFRTALIGAFDVLIGASTSASRNNLVSAVNGTAGAGTTYGIGTTPHPTATASASSSTNVQVTDSVLDGVVSETLTNGTWLTPTFVPVPGQTEEVVVSHCHVYGTHRTCFGVQRGIRRFELLHSILHPFRRGIVDFEPTGNRVQEAIVPGLGGRAPQQWIISGNQMISEPGLSSGVSLFGLSGEFDTGDYNIFSHNLLLGAGIYCLDLGPTEIIHNVIRTGQIISNGASCINMRRGRDVLIAGNYIENPATADLAQFNCIQVVGDAGILPERITVDNNTCHQYQDGSVIAVQGGVDITIKDNRVYYHGSASDANGILIRGSGDPVTRPVVTGNKIKGDMGTGRLANAIQFSASPENIEDAYCDGNTGDGCTNVVAFDRDVTEGGIFVGIPYVGKQVFSGATVQIFRSSNVPNLVIQRSGDRDGVGTFESVGVNPTFSSVAGSTYLRSDTNRQFICQGGTTWVPRSSIILHKELDPASRSYPGPASTITVLQAYTLPIGFGAFNPLSWTLPATVGTVQPGIRFNFSDGTNVVRSNATGAPVTETRDSIELSKDGLALIGIDFIGTNTGATTSQDLGQFRVDGNVASY